MFFLTFVFILFVLFVSFCLHATRYHEPSNKNPYFLQVKNQFSKMAFDELADIWTQVIEELNRKEISIEYSRVSSLVIHLVRLSNNYPLEELMYCAISLEGKATKEKPATQWGLQDLEQYVCQVIENRRKFNEQMKKHRDYYIYRIESLFDKYWYDVTEEAIIFFRSKGFPDYSHTDNGGYQINNDVRKIWAVHPKVQVYGNHYVLLTNYGICFRTTWINAGYDYCRFEWRKGCCNLDFVSAHGFLVYWGHDDVFDTFNLIELNIRAVQKIRETTCDKKDFPSFIKTWEDLIWERPNSWFKDLWQTNNFGIHAGFLDYERVSKKIIPDILIDHVPLNYVKPVPLLNDLFGLYDPDEL